LALHRGSAPIVTRLQALQSQMSSFPVCAAVLGGTPQGGSPYGLPAANLETLPSPSARMASCPIAQSPIGTEWRALGLLATGLAWLGWFRSSRPGARRDRGPNSLRRESASGLGKALTPSNGPN